MVSYSLPQLLKFGYVMCFYNHCGRESPGFGFPFEFVYHNIVVHKHISEPFVQRSKHEARDVMLLI